MQLVPIKELFSFEKGSLQSSKCTPGDFTFITASSVWKTHDSFDHEKEALVFAAAASGSLGRTHYVNGKFVASDLCFILEPSKKYEGKINLEFYYFLFGFIREEIVKKTATGTSKLAINRTNFGNFKLPHFSIEEQAVQLSRLKILTEQKEVFSHELETQKSLIDKLRQSILQDAIQGKLVPQDPNDEPASELLKRIKAEKERLIADKKIKKSKPLPPITDDEKPFDLPQGWEWCRLEEVCKIITDGTHQTPNYTNSGKPFVSAQNVKPFKFIFENYKYVSEEDFQGYIKNRKVELGDILLTRVGSNIGEAAVVDVDEDFAIYVSVGLLKPFNDEIDSKYMCLWLNSPFGNYHSQANTLGRGVSQGNLNLSLIRNFTFTFPPIEEQKQIVHKVDELMQLCDELEEQMSKSSKLGGKLSQSVLQQAFVQG